MNEIRKLLIIGKVWPEPKSSAAGTRMMQLIEFFQKEKFEITFASTAKLSDYQEDLDRLSIRQEHIVLNDPSFDDLLIGLNPGVVVFDRFMTEEQFGWRVIEHCPEAFRILNTEDLHFLRRARQKSLKDNGDLSNVNVFSEDAIREVSSIYRSDLTLLVSEVEQELLISKFQVPSELLYYLPVFAQQIDEVPAFENRDGFMFIGNYYHEPNWDALRYLKKEIWPLIKKEISSATLSVYGAYPGQKVLDFHNEKEGFIVHGRVEDSVEVTMNSRVSLVPIRFGAGIKGKLLEAMQSGTPSVTTVVGSEGMTKDDRWGGVITDDLHEFVQSAIELFENETAWKSAQENGFDILKSKFHPKEHLEGFRQKLNDMLKRKDSQRDKFFIQKLLQHQSLMSNRYLSKWIEEKSKV